MKRILTILTIASLIVLCLLVLIWPVSYQLDLSKGLGSRKPTPSNSVPLLSGYRLGFEDGAMWFYNYNIPYRGGIVWLASTNDPAPVIHGWGFGEWGFYHSIRVSKAEKLSESACDLPGVYFRRFWDFDQSPPYTTLELSLWYPIVLSVILPFSWIIRRFRIRNNSTKLGGEATLAQP